MTTNHTSGQYTTPSDDQTLEATTRRGGIWDAADCALLLIDYQENQLSNISEQDQRVIELNAVTLAKVALAFEIPVVLSTVAVQMGINKPTIPSLKAALPGVEEIDRTSMDAFEDPAFVAAVQATGRQKLVMAGIVTSVCLTYPAVHALADGYEVCFVEDAVGDVYKHLHDVAVLRLAHAGAVPNTTSALMAEWFRDWKSLLAEPFKNIMVPYVGEMAALKRAPEYQSQGALAAQHA